MQADGLIVGTISKSLSVADEQLRVKTPSNY
jgi:hypothetical protein